MIGTVRACLIHGFSRVDAGEPVGVPFVHLRVVGEQPWCVGIREVNHAGGEQLGALRREIAHAELAKRPQERGLILPMDLREMNH